MATFSTETKSGMGGSEYELLIGDGFSLSIGDGFELLIQAASAETVWTAETKN